MKLEAVPNVRYSFTIQFIEASVMFVRQASKIESMPSESVTEALRVEHRGLIVAAVMQCVAALETEAFEIANHGPGSYLGSEGCDVEAQKLLSPLAEFVDKQRTIDRFRIILQILRKEQIDTSREPYQSTILLVGLRNEITHFKSLWGQQITREKLSRGFSTLNHDPPPFIDEYSGYFPHKCLSADCGTWAVRTSVSFPDEIYRLLGVQSRFESVRDRITI
ncbi:MAG: hypothetical protein IPM63_05075 [Acidobacteriota bacterium]|nr:MAG: hypothetical protein IPM63_05075 [Acidobacteriota bacterium]